jgi:hypothetical protein
LIELPVMVYPPAVNCRAKVVPAAMSFVMLAGAMPLKIRVSLAAGSWSAPALSQFSGSLKLSIAPPPSHVNAASNERSSSDSKSIARRCFC